MTYREEWKDFIKRELITSSFKTESELKECYEKAFEVNKSVVEILIGYELSNLLQAEFTIIINKDSVVVNYSKSNSSKEIFVMPCNYYGCQIDHEYIYGKFDEVVPYVIYFILQKYSIKFAQLGVYYTPPKRKKNFGADVSAELEALLIFATKFQQWEDEERKKERFEAFFNHSLEHDFTKIVTIQKI